MLYNVKHSEDASQVVQPRPDVPSTSVAAERPQCDLYADTLNDERTSAFRQSDVVNSPVSCKDNQSNSPPRESQQSSGKDCQVARSRAADRGRSWKELAEVLDRLFFWVMLIAMTSQVPDRLFFWVMLIAMTSCTMIVVLAPVHKHHSAQQ